MVCRTSVTSPPQGSVLPEDSADSVLVVVERHRSLSSEALFVVPHKRAVADLSSCRTSQHEHIEPNRLNVKVESGLNVLQGEHLAGVVSKTTRIITDFHKKDVSWLHYNKIV